MQPNDAHALDAGEEMLWRSFGRLMQRLPREIDEEMMRETGLTMTEFAVLHALSAPKGGSLRVSEIAADIGLSSSRVSRVVAALSARGWCLRAVDGNDGRAALAELTPAGREKVMQALPQHTRLARARILDRIPVEERDIVLRALTAIIASPADRGAGPGGAD